MSGINNNNMTTSNTRSSTAYSNSTYQAPHAAHGTALPHVSSTSVGPEHSMQYGNLSNSSNIANDRSNNMQAQRPQLGENAMTRSEEQLRVQKATVEAGRAELNKTVSVEHVEQAVPVSQEKVVLEREPINASNMGNAMKGPAISEAHYETTLKKDIVTAQKETVPIERIRLAKQTETGIENVSADLRKEHVDLTTNVPDKIDLGAGRTVNDKVNTTDRAYTTQSNMSNGKIDSGLNTAAGPGLSTQKARTETY